MKELSTMGTVQMIVAPMWAQIVPGMNLSAIALGKTMFPHATGREACSLLGWFMLMNQPALCIRMFWIPLPLDGVVMSVVVCPLPSGPAVMLVSANGGRMNGLT